MADQIDKANKSFLNLSYNRRRFLQGTVAAGGAVALTGTLSGKLGPTAAWAQDMPRNETLYIGGQQWGPVTTFNPYNPSPSWPTDPDQLYLFETLFAFNLATGELEPCLAKELVETPETFTITLQDGTMWHDGTPLTANDVVYSYTLAKNHEGLYFSDFWDYVTEAVATDDKTVTLTLNQERLNPGMVKHHLTQNYIAPQHIWSTREGGADALIDIVDMEPVGSGPYKIQEATTERIALVKVDNYWGASLYGEAVPTYVVHPIFDGNDSANLAFSQGQIDSSQTFLPKVWELWEKQNKPVGTWFKEEPYHLPGSIPLLFININKPGLDNPAVRKALAFSINYPQIAEAAMSRYSIPARPSLIIPDGGEAKFFNDAQATANGWGYDPEKAKAILEGELGATKDDGVYVLPDGTRLGPFVAHCPFGWTDWQTAIELVAQSANEAGFEVTTDFPEAPVVTTRNQAGDFDLALWYVAGVSAAGPWRRVRDVLDNRGVPAAGSPAFWNYNRYKNDAVGPLLDQVAAADEATQIELYAELDAIFQADVPAIPLMYRPDQFYEFNETTWTGFATAENPVDPPDQTGAGVGSFANVKPKA